MYAEHGNLVDVDASGAEGSTKHLESRILLGTELWTGSCHPIG